MKNIKSIKKWIMMIAIIIVLGPLLYILSRYNYNLFHLVIELFALLVVVLIFTIAVISRKYNLHSLIEKIGYGMLAVAVAVFLHAISYKGMNVIIGYDANLPTQLWIISNYIQSICILTAIVLFKAKIKGWIFITVYALSALVLAYLCFARIFPVCFVEGEGLTLFKIISEYIIIVIYLISFVLLYTKRRKEIRNKYGGLSIALITFMLAEVMFTLYADVYGIQNFLGHYIRLIGLLILYLNIVISNVQEPYNTIFISLKKSEMTLIESEEKYRLLITQMTQGIALHEIILNAAGKAIDYRFLEVNQGFEELTGLKHEDVIGKTVLEVLPGTDHDWIEKYGQVAMTGDSQIFENYSKELGKYYEVVVYSPKPKQFATIFNDITKRKRAYEELEEAHNFNQSVINSANNGIIVYDTELRFKTWNPFMEKMSGLSSEKVIGKSIEEVFPWQKETGLIDALKRVLKGESSEDKDYSFKVSQSGVEGWARDRIGPLYNIKGEIVGVLGNIQDITEQKKLEEEKIKIYAQLNQQQRLESIGILASGIAHEINNPINGILNYGQLILDFADNKGEDCNISRESVKLYSEEIINESNRISLIVKNLLQFSRMDKQPYLYVKIEDIIKQILSLVSTLIKHDQITLEVHIEPNIPDIECRSQQIQQVLMNLLTNARDALNQRYDAYDANKKIMVSAENHFIGDKEGVRIIVEDHGDGIPQDIQGNIFDPFFTTKSRSEGTGLGLSISYGFVKDHHGELTFETKEGCYTKFYIDLPVDNGRDVSNGN